MMRFLILLTSMLPVLFTRAILLNHSLSVGTRKAHETDHSVEGQVEEFIFHRNPTVPLRRSEAFPNDFPICTDSKGPFAPICLPRDGADIIVEATYYVTWNADFYPLNATITIEMRYTNSSAGESAFTSKSTDNSYGYIPLHIRQDWLQDKPQNELTLYIIELDPASGTRASVRKGPTITLRPKPVEQHKPPPQPMAFNKVALLIGLPISLGIIIVVVAGLFFGMRKSSKIGLGSVMGSRGKGYGIGKSRDQRLERGRDEMVHSDAPFALNKYTDSAESGLIDSDGHYDPSRTAAFVLK
ncbi:hypothetical protein BDV25DRAFT_33575 [Aspergillus avenaceus]|uniref:Uncharacterized protein n=1 Tax=Aspergillus avenaceus TaxID=36643 RepID=A0A5N6TM47_ASPAV|nr:hypothetical protein BDV25DRAFT_33575 [Aspergillus avenaceus]